MMKLMTMIEQMLAAHARLPIWIHDGTRNGAAYHLSPKELKLMEEEYLPRLEQERHGRGQGQAASAPTSGRATQEGRK